VIDSKHQPVLNSQIVLVPNSPLRNHRDRYFQMTTDATGKFKADVIPGGYKVFAWEDVETNAWLNPDFISKVESLGQLVQINEGKHGIRRSSGDSIRPMMTLRFLFAALLIPATLSQRPADTSIQGVIRDALTARPLAGATIEIQCVDGRPNFTYLLSADANGVFFSDSDTLRRLSNHCSFFLANFPLAYGQHNPYGTGVTIHINEGESKRDLRIGLSKGGTITGHIFSKDGGPAAGIASSSH
jgi:hypothetical protein